MPFNDSNDRIAIFQQKNLDLDIATNTNNTTNNANSSPSFKRKNNYTYHDILQNQTGTTVSNLLLNLQLTLMVFANML